MAPLLVLLATSLVIAVAGALGVRRFRPWPVAVRSGLAVMFVTTGISHFVGMRSDLIAMVPPRLPAPETLVTATGILELAGAVGLLWRPTARWAAGGLGLLLIAMYPANAYAAVAHVSPAVSDQLVPRTVIQLVFLAATGIVLAHRSRAPDEQ